MEEASNSIQGTIANTSDLALVTSVQKLIDKDKLINLDIES